MVCSIENELGYGPIVMNGYLERYVVKDCGMMKNSKHIKRIPKNEDGNRNRQSEQYKIPEQLCYELFSSKYKCDVTEM